MEGMYEYMDESSIDPELICSICHSPFKDPRHTPCDDTFCRECITNWIQTQNTCPLCRKSLSANALTQADRVTRNMLDRLQVKCIACEQTELQRGNFADHIHKVCPKTIVFCSSADIKCPWTGQRDQLNQHLLDCRFESIRPTLSQFINESQRLKDRVNQRITQITEQQNEIRQLKEQLNQQRIQLEEYQNINQQLKNEGNQQLIRIIEEQNEIRQLKEQIDQQRTQIEKQQNDNQQLKQQVAQLRIPVGTTQGENQPLDKQFEQIDTEITLLNSQPCESIT